MLYEVRDRAMLKQVKVGDTVKFEAESGDSGFTVTKLQKSSKSPIRLRRSGRRRRPGKNNRQRPRSGRRLLLFHASAA